MTDKSTKFIASRVRIRISTVMNLIQICLSVFVLSVTLSLFNQIVEQSKPNVLRVVAFSEKNRTYYNLFRHEDLKSLVNQVDGIESATLSGGNGGDTIDYNQRRYRMGESLSVTPEYLSTNDSSMLSGGFLTGKPDELVISQKSANIIFKKENPLGKMVKSYFTNNNPMTSNTSKYYRIVGIISNPIDQYDQTEAHFYFPLSMSQFTPNAGVLIIKYKSGRLETVKSQLKTLLNRVYHNKSQYKDVEGNPYIQMQTAQPRTKRGLDPVQIAFSIFATITLVACAVGIFSLQLSENSGRQREVGLLQSMGAKAESIILDRVRQSVSVTLVGVILGLALSAWVFPSLQNRLGTTLFANGLRFDVIIALQVTGVMVLVSALAAWYPATQAAKMRPVEALRS